MAWSRAHLVSVGGLVGVAGPTKLATIVQLDPIYVTFNVSEQEVLRVKAAMAERGMTPRDIGKVPVEVGLMNEEGYPHEGKLDYVAPDARSIHRHAVRSAACSKTPSVSLLPGMFFRIRVPMAIEKANALLVPDRGARLRPGGNYLLVVDKDNVVQQRTVQTGQLVGQLRVITSGITADDLVVVSAATRGRCRTRRWSREATTITAEAPPPGNRDGAGADR